MGPGIGYRGRSFWRWAAREERWARKELWSRDRGRLVNALKGGLELEFEMKRREEWGRKGLVGAEIGRVIALKYN